MLTTQRRGHAVLVCSDQALVVESVCAALADRGFDASGLVGLDHPGTVLDDLARCRAAVMLADLVPGTTADAARSVLETVQLPWVVLTGLEGESRAALSATGAVVLTTSTTLDEVVQLLEELAHRRGAPVIVDVVTSGDVMTGA